MAPTLRTHDAVKVFIPLRLRRETKMPLAWMPPDAAKTYSTNFLC